MISSIMIGAVAVGGAIGAVLRLFASSIVAPLTLATQFPLGTFIVNIVGSLLMGILIGVLARWNPGGYANSTIHLFFATGVLGGFTTFSAFSLDAYAMIQRAEYSMAALYISASVIGGIAALFAGLYLIRMVAQ